MTSAYQITEGDKVVPFSLGWRNGEQIIIFADGRPVQLMKDILLNAARYAWISSHFDEFKAILEEFPHGSFEIQHAINAKLAEAEKLRQDVRNFVDCQTLAELDVLFAGAPRAQIKASADEPSGAA
jgi:hypothetical protein